MTGASTPTQETSKDSSAATPPAPPGNLPDAWAKEKQVPAWKLAALLTHSLWVREPARLVTEAEFDTAIAALDGIRIGGDAPPAPAEADDKKEGS